MAVNCSVPPLVMDGLAGVTAMGVRVRVGAVTVRVDACAASGVTPLSAAKPPTRCACAETTPCNHRVVITSAIARAAPYLEADGRAGHPESWGLGGPNRFEVAFPACTTG